MHCFHLIVRYAVECTISRMYALPPKLAGKRCTYHVYHSRLPVEYDRAARDANISLMKGRCHLQPSIAAEKDITGPAAYSRPLLYEWHNASLASATNQSGRATPCVTSLLWSNPTVSAKVGHSRRCVRDVTRTDKPAFKRNLWSCNCNWLCHGKYIQAFLKSNKYYYFKQKFRDIKNEVRHVALSGVRPPSSGEWVAQPMER